MHLKDLINDVAKLAGQYRESGHVSKGDAEAVLRALGDVAQIEMKTEGAEVPLPGLGKLKATNRAARAGRNPATGEAIQIAARNGVKFVASKTLKDALA